MRFPLLGLSIVAVVAASVVASSAFNYADLAPRTVLANIVSDDGAYLAVTHGDANYECLVAYTSGKIDVTWDAGDGDCANMGDGLNTDAIYYFHDTLKITNKGAKAIGKIWLNMSATTPTTISIADGPNEIKTTDTYADKKEIANLAVGSSYYIGFRIDTSGVASGSNIDRTLSIEARTTE